MSSNKNGKVVLLLGILFSLFASLAFFLICLNSGNTLLSIQETFEPVAASTVYDPTTIYDTTTLAPYPDFDSSAEVTFDMADGAITRETADTTVVIDTTAPQEEMTRTELSSEETTVTAVYEEGNLPSEYSPAPYETTVPPESYEGAAGTVDVPEETTWESTSEETADGGLYQFSGAVSATISGSYHRDRILLLVSLLGAFIFGVSGIALFRRKSPAAGCEISAVLFSLGLLLFTFFPSRIFVYTTRQDFLLNNENFNLFSSLKFNINAGNVLLFFMLYLACSCIFFSLREFAGFLFSDKKEDWALLNRALNKRYPDRDHPQKKVNASILLLVFFSLLLFVALSAGLLIRFRQIEVSTSVFRWVFRCIFIIPALIVLLICAASSLKINMEEMGEVHDEALEKAVKNERLRVDLIANVSHDLRTPLTSILGYGDLLKKDVSTPEGQDHLALLNQKADYMKELVDSLFELTKVASGVLVSEKQPLDLIRLLEQTLGLMEDELESADLTVKRHYERDSIILSSDGQFLNRIFLNLFGNAVKYALKGTRIHLYVSFISSVEDLPNKTLANGSPSHGNSTGNMILVRLTNTASYEMDFDEEEILERFVRGDRSRTTKGSGIGLAIARTYTEALGGHFEVKVDGDQFNALVYLPETNP